MTELATFATLSTAHITEETSKMLTSKGEDHAHTPSHGDWRDRVTVCPYRYGHWVQFSPPTDDPNDPPVEEQLAALPEDLAACFRHVRQFGCLWIRFDRDADTTGGLARYEW